MSRASCVSGETVTRTRPLLPLKGHLTPPGAALVVGLVRTALESVQDFPADHVDTDKAVPPASPR